MKLFYKTSLILVSFTVLLILTISLFVFEGQKDSFKQLLLEESASTVHQKAIHMKNFVDDKRNEIQLLSLLPELSSYLSEYGSSEDDTKLIDSTFLRVLETNPDIDHLRILNLDGHELLRYNSIGDKAVKVSQDNLQDKSNRPYFIEALEADSLLVTNIELNEENGSVEQPYKKTIRLIIPIKNNLDETVAFLAVNYDATNILDELFELQIGHTVIFDQDGNFLLHPDKLKEFGAQLGTNQNYFEEEPELKQNVQLYDSKKHVDLNAGEFRVWEKVFYDDNPSHFWVIASVIPDGILYTHVQDLQNDMILVVSLSLLGTVFVTVLISKHITHPLRLMLNGVKRVEKGDLDIEIKKEHSDEIGELVDSFNQMTQSLKQSKILVDEYQHEIESTLREVTTLNQALDKTLMVSKADRNGNITYVNDKFCKVSKYSKEELLGKNHRIIKGNNPDSVYKHLWNTITSGKTWTGEIKNKAKDGSYFWVYQAITPQLDGNGNPIEYVSLKVDITQRKQTEEKLLRALDNLKEIDVSKNEFAAMISHELRTPLTPILTYCDILRESLPSNPSDLEKECISEIESNAKKLNLLISDVLDAQKLEMNKLKFNYSTFSVSSLVEDVIKDLGPSASRLNVKLTKGDVIDQLLTSDELRITQVLENLIKNSLDFVPKNSGIIEIGATMIDDNVEFYVKDNGMGIPKEKISYLFKKFYQIDSGIRRSHGGTGLGLVICKGIVEGLGGKIWVTSKIGKGTNFFFTIPTKKSLVRVEHGSK